MTGNEFSQLMFTIVLCVLFISVAAVRITAWRARRSIMKPEPDSTPAAEEEEE